MAETLNDSQQDFRKILDNKNLCNDCGVIFDSATSLEIHRSYHHKEENRLNIKWNSQHQENNNLDLMDKKSYYHHPILQQQSVIKIDAESTMETNSLEEYLESNYSPQLQRHIQDNPPNPNDTSSSSASSNIFSMNSTSSKLTFPPQPSLSPIQQLLGGIRYQHNSSPLIFSPPLPPQHFHENELKNYQQQSSGGLSGLENLHYNNKGERASNDDPAEILDLDSHKVHVYQQPQKPPPAPQVRDQQQPPSSFYRPFLNGNNFSTPATTTSSNNTNNWEPQTYPSNKSSYDTGAPFSLEPEQILPSLLSSSNTPSELNHPPPPNNHNTHNHSVFVNGESTNYMVTEDVKQTFRLETTSSANSNSNTFQIQQNEFRDDIGSKGKIGNSNPNYASSSSSASVPSPKMSTNNKGEGNAGSAGMESSSSSTVVKNSKGWKGGECKRPKTYNCTACNKWFTSSGHLKRHYGTTLHKNSIRQNGENQGSQEPSKPQHQGVNEKTKKNGVQKKNGIIQQRKSQNAGGGNGTTAAGGGNGSTVIPATSNGNGLPIGKMKDDFYKNVESPVMMESFQKEQNSDMGIEGASSNNIKMESLQQPNYSISPHPSFPSHPHSSLIQTTNPQNYNMTDSLLSFSTPSIYSISPHAPPSISTMVYGSNPQMAYGLSTNGVIEGTTTGGLSLPPFSSVGYSHYDPLAAFSHLPNFHSSERNHEVLLYNNDQLPIITTTMAMSPNPNSHSHHHRSILQGTSSLSLPSSEQHNAGLMEKNNIVRPGFNSVSPEIIRSTNDHIISNNNANGSMLDNDSNSSSGSLRETTSSGGESIQHEDPSPPIPTATEPVLKCPDCSRTFGRSCYLTQHSKSSHTCLSFKCNTCGKKFSEAPALSDHIPKHGSNKPYKCEYDLCPKQFNHKTDLRRHLCLHTGEKPFICTTCSKGFIRKDHLTKHCETHRKKLKT